MRAALLALGLAVTMSLADCAPEPPLAANEAPAYACPEGWHWVPADYAKHAKWRPAHCAY
jgi:hypothetical protein